MAEQLRSVNTQLTIFKFQNFVGSLFLPFVSFMRLSKQTLATVIITLDFLESVWTNM